MKWTLGDNAVDGIRFVLVGAGSLLVLRLTYAGIHRALAGSGGDALATACAAFQHGYWTTDPYMVVAGAPGGVGPRLALAMVVSVGAASVLAFAVYLTLRLARRAALPVAVGTMRAALLLFVGWSLYAALMLPPAYARFAPDGMVVHRQASLFHEVSLPWGSREARYAWDQVQGFEIRSMADGAQAVARLTAGSDVPLTTGITLGVEDLVRELNLWKSHAGQP